MMIPNHIDDMAFNGRIICELWIVKNVEGSGLAYFNVLGFLCGTEKDGLKDKGRISVGKGVF